jgi:enediyne biosynthesis protein E4
VVVSALNAPARLFRNVTAGGEGWLAIRLRGSKSNRDGIGAVLRLTLSDDRTLTNHCTTSIGYASSSERVVRFGLGSARPVKLEIRWPSGAVQTIQELAADRIEEVTEPLLAAR